MEIDDLLSQQFDVSDALAPSLRATLASACQQLDRAPARPSLGAAEAARVDAERRKALEQALATTHELVGTTDFDLQVLAVLMRLAVEVHGVAGVRDALSMIIKLLDQSWGALERGRQLVSGPQRDKLDRRHGSYLDAVFEQVYFWLARERERSGTALARAFVTETAGWLGLLERVDVSLARVSSKVSRWAATREALEACLRAAEQPVENARAATPAAPENAAPSLAAVVSRPPLPAVGVAVATPAATASAPPLAAVAVAVAPLSISPKEPAAVDPTSSHEALLEVSPRYWELQRRLAAFRALLDGGQLEKARVVAHELAEALQHFDVASYFPGLFASYFEASARHAEALSGPEPLDPIRRSALAQLYRTDLTRFLQLSLDHHG